MRDTTTLLAELVRSHSTSPDRVLPGQANLEVVDEHGDSVERCADVREAIARASCGEAPA